MAIKIYYTKHGLARLRSRGISKKDTREAIISGQKRRWQADSESIKCEYHRKDRTLVVVYKQQKEFYTIITAYYLDK